MEKRATGVIRKIVIGMNPTAGLSYEVGKEFRTPEGIITVTEIVEDQANYYFFGNIRYYVYGKKQSDSVSKVWKFIEKMPVMVEFEI